MLRSDGEDSISAESAASKPESGLDELRVDAGTSTVKKSERGDGRSTRQGLRKGGLESKQEASQRVASNSERAKDLEDSDDSDAANSKVKIARPSQDRPEIASGKSS